MKVTFTLKDLSETFYQGGHGITGLLQVDDSAKFQKLNRAANGDLKANVKQKIGNDSFRDKVELNRLLGAPHHVTFQLAPRKGYKLATFEFSKA